MEGTSLLVGGLSAYKAVMEEWDPGLADHAGRVAVHAEAIAIRLGWSASELETLRLGAMLHDIGKASVREEVLSKPGALDADELAAIRAHPVEGLWLIVSVPELVPVRPYVLFHHERWDGNGYPTRRSGTDIPIEGRILAVADAFDAMTTDRPYRRALTLESALAELDRGSGSQFDPEIASALIETVSVGVHGSTLALAAPV